MTSNSDSETRRGPADYDARYYDAELHRDHWFRNNPAKRARRWQAVLDMLAPAPADRVLEIGCAAGEHTLRLAPLVREIVGVDFAAAAIERAESAAQAKGIANASFVQSDAGDLSRFAAGRFDKAAAIDFVEHIDDLTLKRVLSEVRRVLAPGGRFVIYTPCATHYVERLKARNLILRQIPGHIAVRGPDAYREALERAGFGIRSLAFLPSDYPLAGRVDRALLRLPGMGAWFRFRICVVATAPA
jgi:cyclopropane fatty-acyl-phospholipid synthase-like methyltransferase